MIPLGAVASGGDLGDALTKYVSYLREALVREVRRRARGHAEPALPARADGAALTRMRLTSMVEGLFTKAEREPVLGLFDKAIVFLTRDTTFGLIRETSILSTARSIADIYVGSIGAAARGELLIDVRQPVAARRERESTRDIRAVARPEPGRQPGNASLLE